MIVERKVVGFCAASLVLLTACTASSTGARAAGAATTSTPTTSQSGERQQPSTTAVQDRGSSIFGGGTICGAEISGDLAKIPALEGAARRTHTFSAGRYACTYHLNAGPLVLSVQQSADPVAARGYFASLRKQKGQTTRIAGLQSFGLPAYKSADGIVVYRKGMKTLVVDASRLSVRSAARHVSPAALAYQVATLVIACGHGPGLHHEC